MNKLTAAVLLVTCLVASAAFGQPKEPSAPDEYDTAVLQLLAITGLAGGGGRLLDEMFEAAKKVFPTVPPAVRDELRKSYSTDEFTQLQVAIHKKHFSLGEVRGLIAFYQTPLGRKLVQLQPELFKESMVVGQEFARRSLERLRRQLGEKGYKV